MATIQGVYVALFGRPADPAGLAYFTSVTKNGADLSGIGDLASTQEYKDRFAGLSNVAIVNSIYQSLFNRDAEATGLNFFVDALNKGTLNIKNIAIAILDGAQGADKTISTNKITAADNFTKAIDTPIEIGSYAGNAAAAAGRAFLVGVTASTSTIPSIADTDKAVLALTSASSGGVSLTVTDVTASPVSTSATDTKLKSTNGDDTITVTDEYKAKTKIDAGFGSDTVVIKNLASGLDATAIAKDVLVSVEKLFVTSSNDAAKLDLTNVSGLKEVWSDTSTKAVEFANINAGATLGVKAGATTATFGFKDASTGTTSIALDKANATKVAVTNGSDTVAVSTTGGSKVAAYADANVKTLTLTGSGDLTFTTVQTDAKDAKTADTANLTKVDASALAGKLTIDLAGTTKAVTITGTNNVDSITLDTAGQKDTVVYNKAEASTYAVVESISNFTKAEDKIDLKAFGFTKAGVQTVNTLVENASYGTSSVAIYAGAQEGGKDVTFLFADSNGDGKINLATDFAVKLVGIAAADFTATDNLVLS